jgi:hypothetical protein
LVLADTHRFDPSERLQSYTVALLAESKASGNVGSTRWLCGLLRPITVCPLRSPSTSA